MIVNNIVALKAIVNPISTETYTVLGYKSPSDGGGGNFYWADPCTEAPDDGTIFQGVPSGGRWKRLFTSPINVRWFGATGCPTGDDGDAIQRAVDYGNNNDTNNVGVEVFFPKGIYNVAKVISITKVGVKLTGENKKSSVILYTKPDDGTCLSVKPIFNGYPFPNSGWGVFGLENIAIGTNTNANLTDSKDIHKNIGIDLSLVYASLFENLYVFGFKNHIRLNGCFQNKFHNLYIADETQDREGRGTEQFYRGVAISATNTPVINDASGFPIAGANGLTIDGGWIHNSTLDFTNIYESQVCNIDIEPASGTVITGDNNTFFNCRFERMDLYATPGTGFNKYDYFPWFQVGNGCKFYDNRFHQAGQINSTTANNPIFLIKGNNNSIQLPYNFINNSAFVKLDANATSNQIICNTRFDDFAQSGNNAGYRSENVQWLLSDNPNTITFNDMDNGNSIVVNKEKVRGFGSFTNLISQDFSAWLLQDLTGTPIDINPPNNIRNATCLKLTVSGTGNRRMIAPIIGAPVADTNGVYTFCYWVYIPSSNAVNRQIKSIPHYQFQGLVTVVDRTDRWVFVKQRAYIDQGTPISPAVYLEGNSGEVFYIAMPTLVKGNVAIPVDNQYSTTASDPSWPAIIPLIHELTNVKINDGAALLKTKGPFELYVQDTQDAHKYLKAVGYWDGVNAPIYSITSYNGIAITATNNYASFAFSNTTNYYAYTKTVIA